MWDTEGAFEIKRPATYNNLVYRYRLLCQNFMVTANQKSAIDTHTNKKSNQNITLKRVIRPQEKKTREGKKKDQQKQIQSD